MHYERIIFDIDGTMVDSEQAVRLSLAQLMKEELGVEQDPDCLQFSFGVPGVESLRELGFSDPVRADRRWAELLKNHFSLLSLFDGVRETLLKLKQAGVPLGIVTSKTREEYVEEFEKLFELGSCFEAYICADDTARHKPDPEPLLEYLSRTGGSAERTLYIGDTVFDAECARGAGVDFALAVWGATCTGKNKIKARHFLQTPGEIYSLLRED